MKRTLPLFALALCAAAAAHGTTYWLDAAATGTGDGLSQENAFTTWETAFAAVGSANNNVLNVVQGTYTLSATPATWVRNSVTIQGVKSDGTPITTTNDVSLVVVDGAGLYQIAPFGKNPQNLTLRGITFQNGYGHPAVGNPTYDSADGATISCCVFKDCAGGSAFALGGENIVVEDCIFRDNRPVAASSQGATLLLFGRNKVAPNAASRVRRCVFEGNGAADVTGSAVCVYRNGIVEDCVFRTNTGTGHTALRMLNFQWPGYPATAKGCTFSCNTNNYPNETLNKATYGIVAATDNSGITVLEDCTFEDNYAGYCDTMFLVSTNITLNGCTFTGNSALDNGQYGGASGIYFYNVGYAFLSNCTFRANNSRVLTTRISSTTQWMTDCLFASNECNQILYNKVSTGVGNGLGNTNTFVRCTFDGNNISGDVTRFGMLQLGVAAFDRCKFTGNTSVGNNISSYSGLSLTNCLFSGNSTTGRAVDGGVARIVDMFDSAVNSIVNCTFVNNTSGRATVYREKPGDEIVNCLFAGNTWTESSSKLLQNSGTSHCFADFVPNGDWANVQGGTAGADPKFADAANGDYSLKSGSRCRNTGSNAPWTTDGTSSGLLRSDIFDLADNERVRPNDVAVVDIGCYECYANDDGTLMLIR